MKKLLLVLALAILFINVVGAGQLNIPNDITVGCSQINCSQAWNITILNPNSSILVDNQETTSQGSYINYTITPEIQGTYLVYLESDEGAYYDTTLEVTYTGEEITEGKALIYIGLLALVVLTFLLNCYGIFALYKDNERDDDGFLISISFSKYISYGLIGSAYGLLTGIMFICMNLSYAFTSSQIFSQFFYVMFTLLMRFAPVFIVILFVIALAKLFKDKQTQNIIQAGGMVR